MQSTKKIILITSGDPASIATEITIKSLLSSNLNEEVFPILITDPEILESQKKKYRYKFEINEIKDICNFKDFKKNYFNVIPIRLSNKIILGQPDVKNSNFIKNSIFKAVEIQKNSIASGIVTNPINKKIMYKSGFKFKGHTEYLASLSLNRKYPVMMLVGKNLKTIPLTIHVPLKKVSMLISKEMIIKTVKIANEYLKKFFAIDNPRIIVTGLNPHAGEDGTIGIEEKKIILPAINTFTKKQSIIVSGPVSADTAFCLEKRKNYDVAICMYHDQALIPIKTLDFFNSVNVTLGLDFIRTSPDHGTGYDIAVKNIANPQSLISAINLAYLMSKNRDNAK